MTTAIREQQQADTRDPSLLQKGQNAMEGTKSVPAAHGRKTTASKRLISKDAADSLWGSLGPTTGLPFIDKPLCPVGLVCF